MLVAVVRAAPSSHALVRRGAPVACAHLGTLFCRGTFSRVRSRGSCAAITFSAALFAPVRPSSLGVGRCHRSAPRAPHASNESLRHLPEWVCDWLALVACACRRAITFSAASLRLCDLVVVALVAVTGIYILHYVYARERATVYSASRLNWARAQPARKRARGHTARAAIYATHVYLRPVSIIWPSS